MRAEDVIEMQGRVCDLLNDTYARESLGFSMILRYQEELARHPRGSAIDWFKGFIDETLVREQVLLPTATSFRVSKDMCTLINAATEDLIAQPAPWTLTTHWDELPAESGFVVFEDPLLIKDELTHARTPVKALSWYPSGGPDQYGKPTAHIKNAEQSRWVSVFAWMAGEDWVGYLKDLIARSQRDMAEANQRIDDLRAALDALHRAIDEQPDLTPLEKHMLEEQIVSEMDARQLVEREFKESKDMLETLDLLGARSLAVGMHRLPLIPFEIGIHACTDVALSDPMMSNAVTYGNARMWSILGAWVFWYFSHQTLVERRQEGVPRPFARRWKAKPFPKTVAVITLRRKRLEGDPLGPSGNVEWSHRWMVKGHWKMQPCGPGNSLRKPVYVAPHVKGPDDKPLVLTRRVYDLKR